MKFHKDMLLLYAVTQTENQHFSRPHVQNLFVNSKGNYAHVLTLSRMVQVPDEIGRAHV